MKFGTCYKMPRVLSEELPKADYLELSASEISNLEKEDYTRLLSLVREGCFTPYSANVLLRSDLRLTGPEVDLSLIKSYIEPLFYQLAELGISMLVFGSGKAKNVPEGFPMDKAWEQLYALGDLLADTAAPYGQIIAVEPLSYSEVNIVNTLDEGADYCRKIDKSNFKLLVDFFHFDNNEEPWDSIAKNADLLVHTHFAAPKRRTMPDCEADWEFIRRCLSTLKAIGYEGGISYEGRGAPPASVYTDILMRMKEDFASL